MENDPSTTASLVRVASAPPETLFHYTSAQGLVGIIESGEIWATDLAYLNDRMEQEYGIALVRQAMLDLRDATDATWNEVLIDVLLGTRALPPHNLNRITVACFCEDGDALGHWRGYGNDQGYAIGLDTQKVAAILEGRNERSFIAVSYDEVESRALTVIWARLLREAWEEVAPEFQRNTQPDSDAEKEVQDDKLGRLLYEFSGEHVAKAAVACAYVKHPSFAEEREWRIVQPVWARTGENCSLRFRQGALGLTPYVGIDIRDSNDRIPISQIIVGPGGNADDRELAVRVLLARHGYGGEAAVSVSDVPFRP
jgi:hypothetical protein